MWDDRRNSKPVWRLPGNPPGGGPFCGVLRWFGRVGWRSLSRGDGGEGGPGEGVVSAGLRCSMRWSNPEVTREAPSFNHALLRAISAPSIRASGEYVGAPCAPSSPPRPSRSLIVWDGAMNSKLPLVSAILLSGILLAAEAGPKKELYFPHEHVEKNEVLDTAIPYEKKLMMKENDAAIFILPGQRSVSVWCYRPEDRAGLAEQETRSGLKTLWAEKPWIMPRMKWKALGGGSFQADGWDTYIEHGGVVTRAGETSDYTLYVGQLKVSLIEDLTATNALPVTVRVSQTDRQPPPHVPANGSQTIRSETNSTTSAAGPRR